MATVLTAGAVVTGAVDGAVVVCAGSDAGAVVAADDVAGVSVGTVSDDGAALSVVDASLRSSDDADVLDGVAVIGESVGDSSSGAPSTVSPPGAAGAVVGATSANSVAASTSVVVDASAAPLDPSGDVPAQAVTMNAATSPRARCLRLPGRVGRRVRMGAPWTLEEGALPINRCVPASWMFLGTVVAEYWMPGI